MAFLRDRSIFCIPESILEYEERYIVGGICILTASVGFTGAALQLRSLWQLIRNRQRRQPSPNKDIIFYLALSDLIACAVPETEGQSHHSEITSTHYEPKDFKLYIPVGTTTEVIALFGYLASYIWTFSYALDMCFQMYRIECRMRVYHILAWAIPLELVTIIEVMNFVLFPDTCMRGEARLSRVLLSYAPVMVIMLANPILFIITYYKVKQRLRSSGSYTSMDRAALIRCRRKFLWMVVGFTVCWLPNIISLTYFIWTFDKKQEDKKSKLDKFWYVEAFVNPLQGVFNYFLYRRAFRVTATDTRPEPNALPRVPRTPSLESYRRKNIPAQVSTNQTLQRISSSPSSHDEEAPLITPRNEAPAPRYVYISRLLGE
ncbi:G-protein coupled receptor 143-like isoform X2 [Dendronephthya gigantea]|uniref:G-protein coupled receptor 143-like isoform X2 n=1 Tax=Dendronephthya gigantea TaxID=151771 RepID=UPI00106C132D|nr:G-protein coupled receptor 143-like isoform X2 [Dendronephthya gigantea]